MIKLKSLLLVLIFAFTLPAMLRAEKVSLDLDQAIAIALRNNHDLLMKMPEIERAKLKIIAGQAVLYSALSASKSGDSGNKYFEQNIAQDSLPQYLYSGDRRVNTIQQKDDYFELTQVTLDKTKLELVLRVRKVFFTLLLSNDFSDLNKDILENIQLHLQLLQARYKEGQAREQELFKVGEALNNAKEAYELSLSQVEASSGSLRDLLYLDQAVKIKPVGEFNPEMRELAYDEAFVRALQMYPVIKKYERQEKTHKKVVEKKRQDYKNSGPSFLRPFFDRWAVQAKIDRQIKEESRACDEEETGEVVWGLKKTYLDLKNALAKIKFTQARAKFYKRRLSAMNKKRASGRLSPLDLDDAKLSYMLATFNQKEAIYDYILSKEESEKAADYNQVRCGNMKSSQLE